MRLYAAAVLSGAIALGQTATTAIVSGTVSDAVTHQPIGGAQISYRSGASMVHVTTDANGSYSMQVPVASAGRGPGNGTINISKAGYAPLDLASTRNALVQPKPGTSETHDFELSLAAAITGHLVDRDTGKPIADAWVQAFRNVELKGGGSVPFHYPAAPSTAAGAFSLANLPPGDYTLEVDPPMAGKIGAGPSRKNDAGYTPTWYPNVPRADMAAALTLSPGENRALEMRLQKRELRHIEGTLRVPEGMENDAIGITLVSSDGKSTGNAAQAEGAVSKAGSFHIDGLPAGSYRILAATKSSGKRVSAYANYPVDLSNRDAEDIALTLRPGVTLNCVVTMAEEKADLPKRISFLTLSVDGWGPLEPPAPGSRLTTSDHEQINNLAPGEYRVYLNNLPGYAIAAVTYNGQPIFNTPVDIEARESTITFVLTSRPGSLTGIVRDVEQKTVADAEVVLLPESLPADINKLDPVALREAETDTNGSFHINDLAAGRYRAMVLTGGDRIHLRDIGYIASRLQIAETVTIEAAQSTTLDLHFH